MIELAVAAVEAALAAGARYADARVMVSRQEAMAARNRVVEDLTQSDVAGVGVRALIGSSWGSRPRPRSPRPRPGGRGGRGGGQGFGPGPGASDGAVARPGGRRRGPRPGSSTRSTTSAWPTRPSCWWPPPARQRGRGRPGPGPLPGVGHRSGSRRARGAASRSASSSAERWWTPPPSATGRRSAGPTPGCGASTARKAGSWSAASTWWPTLSAWQRRRRRCCRLRSARRAPPLVLDSSQVALQIHESVGHATELDRILGWEAAFAGTSWLDPAQAREPALRQRPDADHRRRHPARGHGQLRLRRRGRPRPGGRHRAGRDVGGRALGPTRPRRWAWRRAGWCGPTGPPGCPWCA